MFIFIWRCFNIIEKNKKNLINEEIKFNEVLVIGPKGEQLGKKTKEEALTLASYSGFDLVLINDKGTLPVCKLMDYNKFKYEREKKNKENLKKQKESNIETKEIRLSVNIQDNDFNTKVKNAIKLLQKNNKIKISLRFKGRQFLHKDLGEEVIKKFAEALSEYSEVDQPLKHEMKNIFMILTPIKK